jgi:hypothetical protein
LDNVIPFKRPEQKAKDLEQTDWVTRWVCNCGCESMFVSPTFIECTECGLETPWRNL